MSTPSGWHVLFVGDISHEKHDIAESNGWKVTENFGAAGTDSTEICHLLSVPDAVSADNAMGALRALGYRPEAIRASYAAT